VAEHPFQHPITAISGRQAVAVHQQQSPARICQFEPVAVHRQSQLALEEVPHPEIVIAADVIDMDTRLCQLLQHEQRLCMPLGNRVLVFEPEVKQIA
jgi:hypothetical protein